MRQAAQRRQAAEEARKAALLAKQQPAEPPADVPSPPPELAPSDKDVRMRQAAQRRQAAEEARKAELLQKRSAKAEKRETPDADHEVLRIELLLDDLPQGRAGDASRAGLKKQLAAAKAVAVREQRKREMAEREAKRAAPVQQAAPPAPALPQEVGPG